MVASASKCTKTLRSSWPETQCRELTDRRLTPDDVFNLVVY